MNSINDRTKIPVTWAFILAAAIFGPVCLAAMWVKGVDDRLSRIEDKLGIKPVATQSAVIPSAFAR